MQIVRDEKAFAMPQVVGLMVLIAGIIGSLICLKFGVGMYYTVSDNIPMPTCETAQQVIADVDEIAGTSFKTAPLAVYAQVIGAVLVALFGAFLVVRPE